MEKYKVKLLELELRRKRFGNIGILDFLIKLERNRASKQAFFNKKGGEASASDMKQRCNSLVEHLPSLGDYLFDESRMQDFLFQAVSIAESFGDKAAAYQAKRTIGASEDYPEINLLEANYRLAEKDFEGWVLCVQNYLRRANLAPISLSNDKSSPLFFRLKAEPLKQIYNGEKVSVLIAAFNSAETIEFSVQSILQQSWKNLEVIIVDDASTDETWDKISYLAERDDRIKIIRNEVNVGPYVSKNIALDISTGQFITGQDADDWSHPERIENQLAYLKKFNSKAGLAFMLRINKEGRFNHFSKCSSFSLDGALRKSLISSIFDAEFLKGELGYWDCVRFGADSELIARLEIATGEKILLMPFCSMFCLDINSSLTNSKVFGVSKKHGIGKVRAAYQDAWKSWHKSLTQGNTKLGFNEGRKLFSVPSQAKV
ncbi:MAG: glycosyltransferase family 2 protein [Pseudomonadota bacterium]|nr:glycosyltransferase family 2 protein [Pseudomonadota bacterium]